MAAIPRPPSGPRRVTRRGLHARLLAAAVACGFFAAGPAGAATFDTLVFGDTASEAAHDLDAPQSDVVVGGLGQRARRLLPHVPHDVYGGEMSFTMRVDPVAQNYFTISLWGSETWESSRQWLVLRVNGLELGERHGGSAGAPDMLMLGSMKWYPGRFVHRTVAVPCHLTRGRTSVSLRIRSLGWLSYYDSRGFYDAYQKLMNAPSVGLTRASTHTDPQPDTDAELRGCPPALATPRTAETMAAALDSAKRNVNQALAKKLLAPPATLSAADIQFLARCLDARERLEEDWIVYPAPKTAADLAAQVVAAIDAQASAQSADVDHVTKFGNDSWGGYFGPVGDAIRLLWPRIQGAMAANVTFGGRYGEATRTVAWAKALRESIDYGRFHRRSITNQALYAAQNIYTANRGLQFVDPAAAIAEPEALRYLQEACGIAPWLGDDQPTGGADGKGGGRVPTRGAAPFGPNWFQCTSKGTSKDELGFVGSDYGEIGPWVYRLGLLADDESIKAQGLALTRARCHFRFPCDDGDGFLTMQAPDAIGDRNSQMPRHHVYLGRSDADCLLLASQGAAAVGADLIGFAQQQMRDGQLARAIAGSSDPYLPGSCAALAREPETGTVLPMTDGAADFAWVDEENMVVAAKHGEERLFANLYWRQPRHVIGFAKVLHLQGDRAHLADVVLDDLRFRPSGRFVTLGPLVEGYKHQPPDHPVNAFAGMTCAVALRSDLAEPPPENRDGGRGTGYTMRYGDWLVGINAHHADDYAVRLPSGFSSAKDLVSGRTMRGPVVLPPKSSVVFHLDASAGSMPLPGPPRHLRAVADVSKVILRWPHAAGAVRYAIKRTPAAGGEPVTVAEGVTDDHFTDASAAAGTAYRYVVTAVGADGATADSPEASATLVAGRTGPEGSLWSVTDIGIVQTPGDARLARDVVTVAGRGGDLWERADGCAFLHQPMVGDGMLTAQVRSQTSTVTHAKTGLMIRESLDPGARRAVMAIKPAKRVEFNVRTGPGGKATATSSPANQPIATPTWIRLVRRGETFTGLASPDGERWTQIGETRIGMDEVVHAGLVVTACNGPDLNVATFARVTMPAGSQSPPRAPNHLKATPGHTTATLQWQASPDAFRHRVKRAASPQGPFHVVAEVAGTSYTDHGLSRDTTYHYAVSAVSPPHEGADSNPVAVTPVPAPQAPGGAEVACADGAVNLTWTPVPGATSYAIARSETRTSRDSFKVLAADLDAPRYTDTNVKDGTNYFYVVTARNGTATSPSLFVQATPPGLASRWRSQDIGTVADWGHATSSQGTCTLVGSGGDIWNVADEFRYVYVSAGSRCSIMGRVVSCTADHGDPKAGIMIRDSLEPGSRFVHLFLRPKGQVGFEQRTGADAACASIGHASGRKTPLWLRLTRDGEKVVAEHSPDGSQWSGVGTATVGLNDTALMGLTICSTRNGEVETATFDGVRLGGTVILPPAGVNAHGGDAAVDLSWNAARHATGYTVLRSTTSGSGYAPVASDLTDTSWTDTSVAAGTPFFYVVTATDGETTSMFSPETTATPRAKR